MAVESSRHGSSPPACSARFDAPSSRRDSYPANGGPVCMGRAAGRAAVFGPRQLRRSSALSVILRSRRATPARMCVGLRHVRRPSDAAAASRSPRPERVVAQVRCSKMWRPNRRRSAMRGAETATIDEAARGDGRGQASPSARWYVVERLAHAAAGPGRTAACRGSRSRPLAAECDHRDGSRAFGPPHATRAPGARHARSPSPVR